MCLSRYLRCCSKRLEVSASLKRLAHDRYLHLHLHQHKQPLQPPPSALQPANNPLLQQSPPANHCSRNSGHHPPPATGDSRAPLWPVGPTNQEFSQASGCSRSFSFLLAATQARGASNGLFIIVHNRVLYLRIDILIVSPLWTAASMGLPWMIEITSAPLLPSPAPFALPPSTYPLLSLKHGRASLRSSILADLARIKQASASGSSAD